ncbi:flagellar hook-associated protein FlgL, partial [Pseudomonas sp.]|uniref:flagellar hook-associated protein FlgL n=1 Tax=Pseudomonas sp. TaxID=306 RepID=UPI0028AEB3B2
MRISTIQAFNNGVTGIQRNYSNATRTQEQISTGNRILTPADDPVASVRLLQLEQQQNVLTQYDSNLTAAKNSLTQEEVTLNSVNTVLQRVRELAVQAGNGALDPQDRKSIAAELGEREDELLSLMNTRNARGEYLFSGFQGKTQPFVRAADGSYSYQGDEGQRKLQIASSLGIPISDNGKSIFESVTNAGRLKSQPDAAFPVNSTLSVSAPLVSDEVAFSGANGFPASGVQLQFNADGSFDIYELDSSGTPATVPLTDGTGLKMDDDPSKSDSLVFRGVTLQLDGAAAGGEAVNVTPKLSGSGETLQKQGILDTIANLRSALESPANGNSG